MKKNILALAVVVILLACVGAWMSSCSEKEEEPQDLSGWTELEGGRGYLDAEGNPVTGWQRVEQTLYYFTSDGTLASGWTEIDGARHYLNADGTPGSGWTDIDGSRYYLRSDGTMATGWLNIDGNRYYIKGDGMLASGWTEVEGIRCYFTAEGTPAAGWQEIDGARFHLNEDGVPDLGWLELDEGTYYLGEDGILYTGWLELGGNRYYLHEDGTMAVGETVIDDQTYYFSPHGVHILLVNPWLYLPDDYAADLLPVENNQYVEASCYNALLQMLADCEAAGHDPYVSSGYRSQYTQEILFENKTNYYKNRGYKTEEAKRLAGTVVAVPGTSEHQLGLAVDIVDNDYRPMVDAQAETATQQWLMEHCYEYGFILRYPSDKTDITGIIWEPWHYRYVGVDIAQEIRELGVTLEEYLGFTPPEDYSFPQG